jgi:hypothetical protein
MTPDQFNQLLQVLERIASKQYTITGAADWPILLVLGGLLVSVLGFMWHDLRGQLKDHKDDNEKDIDLIWEQQRRCQEDCCPRHSYKEKP